MNMYLCGFQGVGKTFFGQLLAKEIHIPFFDVDAHFLELDGGNHTSVRDLYTTLGKEGYRKKEEKIIASIIKKGEAIVALGGGSLLSSMTQRLVAATGKVIYLAVSKEALLLALKQRIANKDIPAYLDGENPIESFEALYEQRDAIFTSCAYAAVHLEKSTNPEVVMQLKTLWQEIHHGKQ